MSGFQFQIDEAPQAGLRRIADRQAVKILARLETDNGGIETIHESRKALKRLKALFKLARPALAAADYKREYRVVRDVGRSLSGARDLEVMPLTLAALSTVLTEQSGTDSADAVKAVEAAISRAASAVASGDDGSDARTLAIQSAAATIKSARRRWSRLQLADDSFEALAVGAAGGLVELRAQHEHAVESGEDEAYHDWRKSAQLHWRHLRLLTDLWPGLLSARLAATKALADVLGHDHDLSILAGFIHEIPSRRLKAASRRQLLAAIEARQDDLRQEARAYAELIVHEKPQQFAERLSAYRAARVSLAQLSSPMRDLFAEAEY